MRTRLYVTFIHTLSALFPLHTKICISWHAPSRKRRITARFIGYSKLRVFNVEPASCHHFVTLAFRNWKQIHFWKFVDPWFITIRSHLSTLSYSSWYDVFQRSTITEYTEISDVKVIHPWSTRFYMVWTETKGNSAVETSGKRKDRPNGGNKWVIFRFRYEIADIIDFLVHAHV
jgi:predicted acyl esterase